MHHPTLLVLPFCSLLLGVATAQTPSPAPGKADARADARAEAHATADGSRSSQSVTHRVVVINGKTVVDERTVDGKPVPGGVAGPAGGGFPPLPPLGTDPEEMLRKLREQMEREMGGDLPPMPPMPPMPPLPAGGKPRDFGPAGGSGGSSIPLPRAPRPEPKPLHPDAGGGKLTPRPHPDSKPR